MISFPFKRHASNGLFYKSRACAVIRYCYANTLGPWAEQCRQKITIHTQFDLQCCLTSSPVQGSTVAAFTEALGATQLKACTPTPTTSSSSGTSNASPERVAACRDSRMEKARNSGFRDRTFF